MGVAEALIAGGAACIQLRDKSASDRELFAMAKAIAARCAAAGLPFIVNDRADIAVMVDAAGVHVGAGRDAGESAQLQAVDSSASSADFDDRLKLNARAVDAANTDHRSAG